MPTPPSCRSNKVCSMTQCSALLVPSVWNALYSEGGRGFCVQERVSALWQINVIISLLWIAKTFQNLLPSFWKSWFFFFHSVFWFKRWQWAFWVCHHLSEEVMVLLEIFWDVCRLHIDIIKIFMKCNVVLQCFAYWCLPPVSYSYTQTNLECTDMAQLSTIL